MARLGHQAAPFEGTPGDQRCAGCQSGWLQGASVVSLARLQVSQPGCGTVVGGPVGVWSRVSRLQVSQPGCESVGVGPVGVEQSVQAAGVPAWL